MLSNKVIIIVAPKKLKAEAPNLYLQEVNPSQKNKNII